MSQQQRIVILGGHGKIAMLAAPKLVAAGFTVSSVIRNPEHAADIEQLGAQPVVLDIETASVAELVTVFSGAEAVVFSAGAGGGAPERTRAVDFEAAVRSMAAAEQAGISRYVMVSYAGADTRVDAIDPTDSFYPYALAKRDADLRLRETALDYTILGPGRLTLTPATGAITVLPQGVLAASNPKRPTDLSTSRENVAEVLAHVIAQRVAIRETVDFMDGDTPIGEAIR